MEALLSLVLITALLLGSPGPAPLALAATSATFGFRNGVPFLFGILTGLSFAIAGASLGLAGLFLSFPDIRTVCQILGALYIGFIAYKIATAPINSQVTAENVPNFKDGFILNLLNPKAYAAFLAIFSQHLLPLSTELNSYIATSMVCLLVATFVDVIWLGFGRLLKPVFSNPKQARWLRVMFALLMVSVVIYSLI